MGRRRAGQLDVLKSMDSILQPIPPQLKGESSFVLFFFLHVTDFICKISFSPVCVGAHRAVSQSRSARKDGRWRFVAALALSESF